MSEDNKPTVDTIPKELPQSSSPKKGEESGLAPSNIMIKDEATVQPSPSSDSPEKVKYSPLSPKWWSTKKEDESNQLPNDKKTESVNPLSNDKTAGGINQLSNGSKAEVVAVETTVTTPPPTKVSDVVAPIKVAASTDKQTEIKESKITSPSITTSNASEGKREAIATTSTSSPGKSVLTEPEEGKILKTMSDVAHKAIEKSKSSFAKFEQLGISKKSEDVVAETVSEKAPSPALKESFVTTSEKEKRLKAIREGTAQRIENNEALHTQQLSSMINFSITTPMGEKKPEDVVATVVPDLPPVIATTKVEVETAPASSHLDTLVPPPTRPAGTYSQNKNKLDPRSASQTRLNEAYLKQLKGETPVDESITDKVRELKKSSSRIREDGNKEVPLEPLGTGIFNALGDMVGGVVGLAHIMGSGIGKVMDSNQTSQTSGTKQMALGAQEVITGMKEIVKGGSDIVVGTLGMVTVPVVAAIKSIKSNAKSESNDV